MADRIAPPGLRLIAALLIAAGVIFAGIGAADGAKKKVKTKAKLTRTETGVDVKVKSKKQKCVKKRKVSYSFRPPPLPTRGADDDDGFSGLSTAKTNRKGKASMPHNLPTISGLPPDGTYKVEIKKKKIVIGGTPLFCKVWLRLFGAEEIPPRGLRPAL